MLTGLETFVQRSMDRWTDVFSYKIEDGKEHMEEMKKRILGIALALAMACTMLAGCNSGETGGGQSTTSGSGAGGSGSISAEEEIPVVDTEAVQAALASEDSVVLDARSSDAYLGWPEDGVSRNGHIQGAKSFSAAWLTCTYSDTDNLEQETREQVLEGYLEDKGLTADKSVIIYDAQGGAQATRVAEYLISKGITDVSLYDLNDWADDTSLEMVAAPNYEMLVPAWEVKNVVDGNPTAVIEDVDYQLFDVAWGEVDQSGYLDGHVPGSVHVNTDWFEPPDGKAWMLADDDVLLDLMLQLGITVDSNVIVTGPEPMAACRFAIILNYMGVDNVYVMSGGLVGWSDAGYELETENVEAVPVDSFGAKAPVNPQWIDTIEETQEQLAQGVDLDDGLPFTLVDNRTWEEYIGEITGYSYHDKAGRIEGAVFGYAGKVSSSSVCYYRNIDKTMRAPDEIMEMWAGQGIDPETSHLSFMCGSGWRAAEIMWYARVMGFENVSLYSDGWIGWSNAGLPYVTGDPTAAEG